MFVKFPPLPLIDSAIDRSAAPAIEHDASLDSLRARCRGAEPDWARDILWTCDNLENRRVAPDDAPSLGAWSLLKWARDYRNRFFEQLVPKAIAVRSAPESSEVVEDISLDEVRAMLDDFHRGRTSSHITGIAIPKN